MSGALVCDKVRLVRDDPARGPRTVLDDVSARFEPGRITLITGPTGAGKSSLVHLLGGLLRPTAGTIWAGEAPVSRWVAGHRDAWRKNVGLALQAPNLLPELSVVENVMLPLVPRARSADDALAQARGALEAAGVAPLADARVTALSGGQRQRVALARATVAAPAYLLADEPTAHQDDGGAEIVRGVLAAARDRGAAVVITAHDPRLVQSDLPDLRWRLEQAKLQEVPA